MKDSICGGDSYYPLSKTSGVSLDHEAVEGSVLTDLRISDLLLDCSTLICKKNKNIEPILSGCLT